MAVIDNSDAAREMIDRYAPGAPDSIKTAAENLLLPFLQQGAGDMVNIQMGGQSSTFRDAMRGDPMRRSGAAGLLSSWRVPRARPIGKPTSS